MNRKKRLEKGIESLEEQIKLHQEKIDNYVGSNPYLIEYWGREIEDMKKRKENRKSKIERK
ncbi:MAG: hypothetical protein AABX11_00660 [Nanoarchaeota archaeon]